jgi:hypothetical protein
MEFNGNYFYFGFGSLVYLFACLSDTFAIYMRGPVVVAAEGVISEDVIESSFVFNWPVFLEYLVV